MTSEECRYHLIYPQIDPNQYRQCLVKMAFKIHAGSDSELAIFHGSVASAAINFRPQLRYRDGQTNKQNHRKKVATLPSDSIRSQYLEPVRRFEW